MSAPYAGHISPSGRPIGLLCAPSISLLSRRAEWTMGQADCVRIIIPAITPRSCLIPMDTASRPCAMRPRLPTGTTPSPLGGENLYSFWPREPAGGSLFPAESPVQFNFLEIKLPFRKAVGAPQPPKHLKPATRAWFASVCEEYELDEHHLRLLALAGE